MTSGSPRRPAISIALHPTGLAEVVASGKLSSRQQAGGAERERVKANRWLHLRHPDGFSPEMFERFRAGCALWEAFVCTSVREWERLGAPDGAVKYACLPPELSLDRKVATCPLVATSTIGSRAKYENAGSYLLRAFLPPSFHTGLEEGLTEDIGDGRGPQTSWRTPADVLLRPQVPPWETG